MLTGLLEHVVNSSEVAFSPGSWKESSLTLGSWKESRLLAMLEASSKVVEYNEEREDGLVVEDEVELISSCSESEKPCQRVSNADRKVFATSSLFAEEFPDILENVRILYKISR